MNAATADVWATAAVNIVGMMCLVYYSVNRKFKADNPAKRTWREWIDRWRVELIIAGVLIPQWAEWAPKALGKWLGN